MALTATALTVVRPKPGPEADIETHLDAREKAKEALVAIDDELAKLDADLAQQIVSQVIGKPKLDSDAVLGQFRASNAKRDQLKEKRTAVVFLLKAVSDRLDEFKKSAPAEFIIVLTKRIAEQKKTQTKTQDEAQRARAALDALNNELAAIVAVRPAAKPTAPAKPAAARRAASKPAAAVPASATTTRRRSASRKRTARKRP